MLKLFGKYRMHFVFAVQIKKIQIDCFIMKLYKVIPLLLCNCLTLNSEMYNRNGKQKLN